MKTIDLTQQHPSVDELLEMAAVNPILIRNHGGQEFLLETADGFDREVAELSRSERFMSFLAMRSKEPGKTSIDEIDRRVKDAEAAMKAAPPIGEWEAAGMPTEPASAEGESDDSKAVKAFGIPS